MHSTMCPHCGQRGEAVPTRRKVSRFGARQGMPLVVRRLIVCSIAGAGAIGCLAFANWVRPASRQSLEEAVSECDAIRDTEEEFPGELSACEAKLVKLHAVLGDAKPM